jgi:hypothetical protein
MQTIGKFLAGICAVLFVITGVAALLLFNIERKGFSSDSYKRAFENQKLYERMPAILASALSTSVTENENANPILKILAGEDWEASISALLPPEELKTMTDEALDSIFAYLNGEADSASLSIISFKAHLASPAGADAVLKILESQPDCTTGQLLQMTLGAITGSEFIFCSPPQELTSLVRPLLETQLGFTAAALPDQITLISGAQSGTENDPRESLNRIRTIMKLTPILPLALLVGILIFTVRSLLDWLRWWGYPFLITGATSLVISIVGAPLVGFIIQQVIEIQAEQFTSPILLSTLRETTSAVARQILTPVAIQAFLLTLLGFAMILAAFFLKRRAQLSAT